MGCGASADNDNSLRRESRSRATSYVPLPMLHGSVAAGCAASCSPAASSLGGDSTATKSTDGEQLRRAKAAASRMIDAPEEATTALKMPEPEPRLFSTAESSNRSYLTAAASEGNPLSPPRRAPLTANSLKELQRVLEEQDHAPR